MRRAAQLFGLAYKCKKNKKSTTAAVAQHLFYVQQDCKFVACDMS